ncbi:chorion class A protein Ld2/Ld41-like [Papilio machaon]|uniref:chorion class A protein Ld2/Ld41-like n=1 Tax=Papilio machaon TaxID=76193 RepID=UPI001E66421C|nr:chorion class A protein Ld2/Ld41-like [Papilio machaon]
MNNGYGLANTPIANTIAASPINGISPSISMTNPIANAPIYASLPSETIGIGTAAINTANAITAGVTGLEGFSLGGIPMSGVSPMGYGDVTVLGELPVGGSTGVTGNVPVIGYVTFEGTVPAGGTVTLASNCGCSNPTVY